MDPVDISNPEVIRLKQKAIDCLHQIDQSLKLHDFRMVSGISHSNLVFDVLIPFDLKIDEKTILDILTSLSFKVLENKNGVYKFEVPSFRATKDINGKADLV